MFFMQCRFARLAERYGKGFLEGVEKSPGSKQSNIGCWPEGLDSSTPSPAVLVGPAVVISGSQLTTRPIREVRGSQAFIGASILESQLTARPY